jgi:quinol-cytochrome oxidoreductase complex cytochrome b subunit
MASGSNPFKSGAMRWFHDRLPILGPVHHGLFEHPYPKNLTYWWNFGSLSGFMLVIMILSGLFLAMNYVPTWDGAFASVQRIMRDVPGGDLIRRVHVVGSSLFFVVVYFHIARSLYYGSYKPPREMVWLLGLIIYLLMSATAFLGYVLPNGGMSFAGAEVITGFLEVIPLVGLSIKEFILGASTTESHTLGRFFVLHFLMPFVIVGVVLLHIVALHAKGSNNPLGVDMQGPKDTISFHPYYTWKDIFGLSLLLMVFALLVFYMPDVLGEPINYAEADRLKTPEHIVPEWYFLHLYAMLKSIDFNLLGIPGKTLGVLAMLGAIGVLFILPLLDFHPVRSGRYRPLFKIFFWVFVVSVIVLAQAGGQTPEDEFRLHIFWLKLDLGLSVKTIGRLLTAYYFVHFLVILPLLSIFERALPVPNSIAEPIQPRQTVGGGVIPPALAGQEPATS